MTFMICSERRAKCFLHTYLIAHFISHVQVGFVRKWCHHVIYIVPGLGPHIS